MRSRWLGAVAALGLAAACASSTTAVVRPSTTRAPVAASTSTSTSVPGSARPLRVLVVGDSVMFDAAPAIRAAFESTDRATVRVEPYLGMGLTKTDLYDWHTGWPALMADVRPDLVVLLLGAWDVPGLGPRPTGPRTTGPPPPGWGATYRTLVQQAAAVLTSGGTSLVWVGLPWVAPIVAAPEQVWAVDRTIATVTRGRPRVTYVDGPAVLAGPDGRFAAFLPDAAGRRVRVRKLDGIHLCPAGAARLAIAVLGALPPEWRLMPASGWEDGAWRTDARYSVAAGCTPS